MNKQEETLATWNKVAKLYEEKFMPLDLYNDSYDLFCAALQNENAAVLDVACGPGNITQYLLNKIPSLQIDAIDFSPNMIALAQANNPSANCFIMNCKEINKLQKKYDGIICGFGLPYLSDIESENFIENTAMLLQSNGVLYISFVEGNYADNGFKTSITGARTYFYCHSLQLITNKLKEYQYTIEHTLHVNYNTTTSEKHSLIIARKTC